MPGTIEQDLRRRDFSVNAMAAALGGEWSLLDPLGGVPDLSRRRLRVLHPLSFVDDPTRMLRGARYAARLDFHLDPWTVRCQALAVDQAPYPALSGHRIAAELARVVADAHPAAALARLGRARVFRIVDARYWLTRRTARAVAALDETLAWSAAHGLAVPAFPLALVALVADQRPAVATAFLERLSLRGEPLARILRALQDSPRPLAPLDLAARYLRGDAATRARLDAEVAAMRREQGELRGDDLLELGVPRGPAVGAVLDDIRGRRRRGEIADRAAEIDYVRSWVSQRNRDDEREG
jgi:tRNA nucleotidyltransferase (CCA-adding enzyme)